MKKWLVLLFLCLTVTAGAENITDRVDVGDTRLSFVTRGEETVLVAEQKKNGTYETVFENAAAADWMYQNGMEIEMMLDTDGETVYITYRSGSDSLQYDVSRDAAGAWRVGTVTAMQENENGTMPEECYTLSGGLMHCAASSRDESGYVYYAYDYLPVPMDDNLSLLQNFSPKNYLVYQMAEQAKTAFASLLPDVNVHRSVVSRCGIYLQGTESGREYLYILDYENGEYTFVRSSVLPSGFSLDDTHSFSSICFYEQPWSFMKRADGRWGLSYIGDDANLCVGIDYIEDSATGARYYGTHPWMDITTLDFSALPNTLSEALAQVDGSGYARVNNPVPTDRLHLRASPSSSAASLGKYYNGTPVKVLSEKGDFVQVDIYGVQGWMMKKYLAFGADMQTVDTSHGYYLTQRPEYSFDGVPVYTDADKQSAVKGYANGEFSVLAVVGDMFVHIITSDGLAGYVPLDCLWEGNG